MFVILTVLMTIVVVGCGGELPSSAEIVCESFVECIETDMTVEECMDQRFQDMEGIKEIDKFQTEKYSELLFRDIDRGKKWNECVLELNLCDRYFDTGICSEFDEFIY